VRFKTITAVVWGKCVFPGDGRTSQFLYVFYKYLRTSTPRIELLANNSFWSLRKQPNFVAWKICWPCFQRINSIACIPVSNVHCDLLSMRMHAQHEHINFDHCSDSGLFVFVSTSARYLLYTCTRRSSVISQDQQYVKILCCETFIQQHCFPIRYLINSSVCFFLHGSSSDPR